MRMSIRDDKAEDLLADQRIFAERRLVYLSV
jgi:hypothetical protein